MPLSSKLSIVYIGEKSAKDYMDGLVDEIISDGGTVVPSSNTPEDVFNFYDASLICLCNAYKTSVLYCLDALTAAWYYTFKVKDTLLDVGQVNYGSPYDEAIDGSLRTNLRGFRISVDLPLSKLYDALVDKHVSGEQPADSALTTFLDDMIASLVTDGDEHLVVSFNGYEWHKVIPDSSSYRVAYTNQIARSSGSIKLIGQEIITSIPSSLEAPSV